MGGRSPSLGCSLLLLAHSRARSAAACKHLTDVIDSVRILAQHPRLYLQPGYQQHLHSIGARLEKVVPREFA